MSRDILSYTYILQLIRIWKLFKQGSATCAKLFKMAIKIEINDTNFQRQVDLLQKKMGDLTPFFRSIGNLVEQQSRESFDREASPSGMGWRPSERKKRYGGKTLTLDGHLVGSINSKYGRDYAAVGANRTYAAIHQLGGNYAQKVPAHTRTMTHVFGKKVPPYKQNVRAHTRNINMPKRAYLPEQESDIDWAVVKEIFNIFFNK